MSELTVASTTDTQKEIEQVATGVAAKPEPTPQPKGQETEQREAHSDETEGVRAPEKPSKSASQRRYDALTRRIKELEAQVSQPPREEAVEQRTAEITPQVSGYEQWLDSF